MDQQLFTDGIGRISVIGGIVRLDLVTYSPTETDAQGQPRAVFTQRIVMGVDGFLRSSEKVLETVQVITRAQQQQAAQQPRPARPAAPQSRPAPAAAPVPPEPPPSTPAPQPVRKPPFP